MYTVGHALLSILPADVVLIFLPGPSALIINFGNMNGSVTASVVSGTTRKAHVSIPVELNFADSGLRLPS